MTEAEKKKHRACFTGHRPEKIFQSEEVIIKKLELAIWNAFVGGYNVFISGMARGADIWAAEAVLSLKEKFPDIRLICALPYPDFEKSWSIEWRRRFRFIIDKADMVKTVSSSFSMNSYNKRNRWMVDHTSLVIAVYSGRTGGTRNTIEYAVKRQIPIINIIKSDVY